MNKIYKNFLDLVGNTPMLELQKFNNKNALQGTIVAKLEYFNPAGSMKDRIAKQMILDALESGAINQDTTLIEPTSGNTGIGLSAVAASLGMKIIMTMPESMSLERRKLIQIYGAELVLTPAAEGMKGAIKKAEELSEEIPNSFIPSQFQNPSNPKAHYLTTGPEIFEQMDGKIDVLVAGIGTGGSISGIGKYLKEKLPDLEIIGIEPTDSPVLTKGTSGAHKIQGIGAGFIPGTLDTDVYNKVITVSNEDAFTTARELVKTEGILVGISSGAALFVAKQIALQDAYKGKNIVVILPDGGDRYLSTPLFDQE
ncbi:MAG: cysteine synthase A [Coprobacillaceae bacterium]